MSPLGQGPFTPLEEIPLRNRIRYTYMKYAGNNLKGLLARKEGVI